MTEFIWVNTLNPFCGVKLKQPVLVTVTAQEDGQWVGRVGCLDAGLVAADRRYLLDYVLATMVTRFYRLQEHYDSLAPDLYDEWRKLHEYLG